MSKSCIIAAKRSAVVPVNGAFAALQPHELATPVMLACLDAAGLAPEQVDEVIVGNALGAGGNPARLCSLDAGLPERVAGLTIDRQCVSGLDAIRLADAMICSGQAHVVLAGGAESYSRRPMRAETFADGRPSQVYDQARFTPWPDRDPDMHVAAHALAMELGISKAAQDAWAVQSHAKAMQRREAWSDEIVEMMGVTCDPFSRALTLNLCARATPITGTITPANTSVAADGAAFCLVVSEQVAATLGVQRLRISASATLGARPDMPGLAPIAAIEKVLGMAGMRASDVTVAEIMEAYAVQAIACVNGAGIDLDIVNRGGGSLARGHPVGASGAVNAVRLCHELMARGGTGLAAIAAAGGLGTALILGG